MGYGRAVTRMRAHSRIARARDDPRPHPLALVGLIDHALGNAFGSLMSPDVGMSTLDLTIGFAAQEAGAADIISEARTLMLDEHSATGDVRVCDVSGTMIAVGVALFTTRHFPGGTSPAFEELGHYDAGARAGPFTHLLGLSGEPGRRELQAHNPAVIGWESGNKIHGGAIGALLMAACLDRAQIEGEIEAGKRLASLYVRYLRPASGIGLHSTSAVERLGRTASYFVANCSNEPGKHVATAHATFVSR